MTVDLGDQMTVEAVAVRTTEEGTLAEEAAGRTSAASAEEMAVRNSSVVPRSPSVDHRPSEKQMPLERMP
jgi:hypothetical protein